MIASLQRGSLAELADAVAEPIGVPLHHDRPLWRLAGAKGHLVGVDARGGLVVWDAKTARPVARFQATGAAPEQIAISPDGQRLALCAGPNAELIDLDTGAPTPLSTRAPIATCGWLPDGRFALVTAAGVETFDAKTLAPLETLPATEPVGLIAPDSFRGWAVTPRGLVDPATDRPVLALPDSVVAFGDQVATLRGDTATLWTFGGLLIGHSDAITAIVPRGDRVLTASRDGLAIVWKNGAIQHAMPRAAAPLVGAGFVTDTRIATGDAAGLVQLWDVDSATELARWTYPAGLACLAVQADGRVAVATLDRQDETRDAVLTHPQPLAAAPCKAGLAPAVTMGDWQITGDAAGRLRLRPLGLQTARARACGILRRFERNAEVGAACN